MSNTVLVVIFGLCTTGTLLAEDHELPSAVTDSPYGYAIRLPGNGMPPFTYGLEGAPRWLSIRTGTAVLEGTPTQQDAGTFRFNVVVKDLSIPPVVQRTPVRLTVLRGEHVAAEPTLSRKQAPPLCEPGARQPDFVDRIVEGSTRIEGVASQTIRDSDTITTVSILNESNNPESYLELVSSDGRNVSTNDRGEFLAELREPLRLGQSLRIRQHVVSGGKELVGDADNCALSPPHPVWPAVSSSGPQVIAVAAFGGLFAVVMLVVAMRFPEPTAAQWFVFRVILALTAAGVAVIIPGFLVIHSTYVRAGGGVGVFALVYFMNPPKLAANPRRRGTRVAQNRAAQTEEKPI